MPRVERDNIYTWILRIAVSFFKWLRGQLQSDGILGKMVRDVLVFLRERLYLIATAKVVTDFPDKKSKKKKKSKAKLKVVKSAKKKNGHVDILSTP